MAGPGIGVGASRLDLAGFHIVLEITVHPGAAIGGFGGDGLRLGMSYASAPFVECLFLLFGSGAIQYGGHAGQFLAIRRGIEPLPFCALSVQRSILISLCDQTRNDSPQPQRSFSLALMNSNPSLRPFF